MSPQAQTNWPTQFTVCLDDHMSFINILLKELYIYRRESNLYELFDYAFNFNSVRTTLDQANISIHPQATLSSSKNREQKLQSAGCDAPISSSSTASETVGLRTPDFIARITSSEGERRIMFICEIKPFPALYTHGVTPKEAQDAFMEGAFRDAQRQILEQVQFGFADNPEENQLDVMCFVGLFFKTYKFIRSKTPKYDEHFEISFEEIAMSSGTPRNPSYYHLLNERQTDYSQRFKTSWTAYKKSKGFPTARNSTHDQSIAFSQGADADHPSNSISSNSADAGSSVPTDGSGESEVQSEEEQVGSEKSEVQSEEEEAGSEKSEVESDEKSDVESEESQ